ncbi:hypothetical protein QBD00_002533 [Ochrobactrum sp. AN78]|nr:hypothetical protein [Ochrobactrum sp. AN78]
MTHRISRAALSRLCTNAGVTVCDRYDSCIAVRFLFCVLDIPLGDLKGGTIALAGSTE